MKYLKPHLYMHKVKDDHGEHYELTALIHCEDNLELVEVKPPEYQSLIQGADPRYQGLKETVINVVFKHRNNSIPSFNKPIELFFVLEPSKMDRPEEVEIRVKVNAVHPITNHTHDGSSTNHYGDGD